MSIPIWVTDPTGNNNPYLAIKPPTIFVAAQGGSFDAEDNFLSPGKLFYSSSGTVWSPANVTLPTKAWGPALDWANGTWMAFFANFNDTSRSFFYSIDGVSFSNVFTDPAGTATFTYHSGSNTWTISNGGPTITIPYTFNAALKEDELINAVLADPSQTAVTNPSNIAKNSLPTGYTAMRWVGPAPQKLQLTQTPITLAIINSGSNWPGATWNTVFTFSNTGALDTSNNDIQYAPNLS